MGGLAGLAVYTLLGLLATVVMQSSHATLVLIITALGAGQVTYENALALAIGSNIGTTVTAVLGALSAPVEGKRLAGAHLVFNVGTGLIALLSIDGFVWLVEAISERVGIDAEDYTLKLAVFHTLFNAVGVLVFLPLIDRLVAGLERMMKPSRPAFDAPRYLSEASLELPETALIALRRETAHLFDNAFTLIAHGVNLRRSYVVSERDLGELLEAPSESIEIDIDRQYALMIKDIQSANLAFYSRATVNATQATQPGLQALWQANLDIVAAIKAVKHLRKNLNRHARSPNVYVRREYNRFRIRIAEVLREIALLRDSEIDELSVLSLDSLRLAIQDGYLFNDRVVDSLIREEAIAPQMATSMMNDNRYVDEILRRLLATAENMFLAAHQAGGVAADLALAPDEIDEIVDQAPQGVAESRDAGRPL
jgi:phosphate:Na+ symporter